MDKLCITDDVHCLTVGLTMCRASKLGHLLSVWSRGTLIVCRSLPFPVAILVMDCKAILKSVARVALCFALWSWTADAWITRRA